jgi:polyisoprenoid-binding protein YceI
MRIAGWQSAGTAAGAICIVAILASAVAAPPRELSPQAAAAAGVQVSLDPAQSKVHYTVDSTLHTVHGTFNVKSGTMTFDPAGGKANGEVIVYAASGDSGNSSRDARMHKEILETQKYPDAVFHPTEVQGAVTPNGVSDVRVRGIITLHGRDHEIVAMVHTEMNADQWKGTAKFEVPYIQWGIKDPSNWMLKVKPVVNVELEMAGTARPSH